MNRKTKKNLLNAGYWFLVVAMIMYAIFPFYYAIITSFKLGSELFEVTFWIQKFNFENYLGLFSQQNFGRIIFNSFLVSGLTVVVSLIISISASYALATIQFKGKAVLLYLILGVSMFPQIAVLSGLYTLLQLLNLFNNWFGLTFAYLIFTLPFTIWVLTSFIKEIPIELDESARIDGATPMQTVIKIYLPILGPATATTGLLAFIAAWNEFLFALTFTVNEKARTIPVAISFITGSSKYELPFGSIMAASVLVTFPLIALVLIFQKQIISGLTAGSVKG